MAKSKRKSKGKNGYSGASVVLAGVAGEVLGSVLTRALNSDYVSQHLSKGSKKKGEEGGASDDVATRVLRTLVARGPLNIPDLLAHTGVGLAPALHALQDVREFRLVEFGEGDDDKIRLTAVGCRTATVLAKSSLRRDAATLLEK